MRASVFAVQRPDRGIAVNLQVIGLSPFKERRREIPAGQRPQNLIQFRQIHGPADAQIFQQSVIQIGFIRDQNIQSAHREGIAHHDKGEIAGYGPVFIGDCHVHRVVLPVGKVNGLDRRGDIGQRAEPLFLVLGCIPGSLSTDSRRGDIGEDFAVETAGVHLPGTLLQSGFHRLQRILGESMGAGKVIDRAYRDIAHRQIRVLQAVGHFMKQAVSACCNDPFIEPVIPADFFRGIPGPLRGMHLHAPARFHSQRNQIVERIQDPAGSGMRIVDKQDRLLCRHLILLCFHVFHYTLNPSWVCLCLMQKNARSSPRRPDWLIMES